MFLSHPTTSRIDLCVALAMPGVRDAQGLKAVRAWDGRGEAASGYSGRFDNQFVLPPS
jgi:hypothetical protein